MSELKKYNRFLISNEEIPRRTRYRRRVQENSTTKDDAKPEIAIDSDSRYVSFL